MTPLTLFPSPAAVSKPEPAPPPRPDRLTASALRARGWTDAAIRRFLGTPDAIARNPVFRSAAPMKLYDAERVAAVESSPEWQAWRAESEVRRVAAAAGAQRRRDGTVAAVAAVEIRLPALERAELERRAVEHRNRRAADRAERRGWWDDYDPATVEGVDEATLARWSVNYLRHQGTRYDATLGDLYAQVGRHEAAALLRRRIYEEIGRAYPWLAGEADRQRQEREEPGPWPG
jgi:hypothetical protein